MAILVPVKDAEIKAEDFGKPVADWINARTPTNWVNITLTSPWVNEGGGLIPASYRKIGDTVELRGSATRTGAPAGAVFVLPIGFRPPFQLRIGCFAHQAAVGGIYMMRIDMAADGTFVVNDTYGTGSAGVTNPVLYLNGITFSTLP